MSSKRLCPKDDGRSATMSWLRHDVGFAHTSSGIRPDDILYNIIIFTDIIGKHILRFICKHLHHIVHKVAIFNLKLPKYFNLCNFNAIIAKFECIDLFDWLIWTSFGKSCLKHRSIDAIVRTGNLDSVKRALQKHNLIIAACTGWGAAKLEDISILKFLREKRHEPDEKAPNILAKKGNLAMLKWTVENKCPFYSPWICSSAARGGRVSASF
jgi:hypothetical protein